MREKREKILRLVLTEDEQRLLQAAADSAGIPLAVWARATLLKEAKKIAAASSPT